MTPLASCRWIDEVMAKEYPLGVIKDTTRQTHKKEAADAD
jgi:hypothetical protein